MGYPDKLTKAFAGGSGKDPDARRSSLLEIAKEFFSEEKRALYRMHLEGAGGAAVVAGYTSLVDSTVKSIYAAARGSNNIETPHALIALGGYGRRELCLCSDLDITIVHEGGLDKDLEALNDYVLHFLWDIGFRVGHSIRSIEEASEAAEKDITALTSMIESRFLAGEESTYTKLIDEMSAKIRALGKDRFVRRKKKERASQMREAGDEVYHTAPNIKLTAGGLRDYHTGIWIAIARFGLKSLRELFNADLLTEEQFLKLEKALDFIWRVRNQMYFGGGWPEDVLTLSRQEKIAAAFGYRSSGGALAVELFMQDYYVHALELNLFYQEMLRLAGLSKSHRKEPVVPRGGRTERGLRVANRQVYPPSRDAGWFARNPHRLLEIIWYAQKHGFTLSESASQGIERNIELINDRFLKDPLAVNYFLAILSDPLRAGASARLMSDMGILDRYIPEFAAIRNIVRYQDFHQHPVDEHTLRALESIASIPQLNEPGSSALKKALSEIKEPADLMLAILLHDLGKIEEDNHIGAGVRTAEIVGERLALSRERIDTLIFLVSSHMAMTHLSRYRDLDDPEIISSFAAGVESVRNLNLLYLLTYADLRAARLQAWSDWISVLLYRLYTGTREELIRPADAETRRIGYRDTPKAEAVSEYLKTGDSSAVQRHLAGLPPRYLTCFSPKEIAEHMRMAASLEKRSTALRWVPVPDYSLSQITVCTKDRPGLFAEIVGAFASQQVSVLDAAIFTRADGIVLDSFHVVDGRTDGPLTSTKWAVVRKALRKALRGERDIERLIRNAERNPLAAQSTMSSLRRSVSFDNAASTAYTIIDIEAPDRVGLLYDIASAIFELRLDISVARIATDDRQARDAFYVSDTRGNKIEAPLRLEEIRKTIERVIDTGLDYAEPDENRSDKQTRKSGKNKEKRRITK